MSFNSLIDSLEFESEAKVSQDITWTLSPPTTSFSRLRKMVVEEEAVTKVDLKFYKEIVKEKLLEQVSNK